MHTLPSHEHLGNHPEDWFPSITSRIVTNKLATTTRPVKIFLVDSEAADVQAWVRIVKENFKNAG